ncbi:hypothetical protein RIF29_37303 [Crotalaria pallida]|uniref:RING-type E3 ubiquitin transferase n=1 Tax=Crotalaria pallida TaxID=3830 RepID=A0AAN9EC68_CROPI
MTPPTTTVASLNFTMMTATFAQIEINRFGRSENPPASKAAIELIPTIVAEESHVCTDSHCVVCKEALSLVQTSEAHELPCKHIYHSTI